MIAVLDQLDRTTLGLTCDELCRTLGLKAGTVYPILIRLVQRNLVESAWQQSPPPGRPPRYLYRLWASGRAVVAELVGLRDSNASIKPVARHLAINRAG